MAKVKLTHPTSDPWTHVELPQLNEAGKPAFDASGNPLYQEFHTGDVVEVSDDTAEHLVRSGQGEIITE